jgi:hypothetical protein
MTAKAKIIKQTDIPASPFDGDFARMEAENVEKIFMLHYRRCDDATTADDLSEIFLNLGKRFAQKKIDLTNKIS